MNIFSQEYDAKNSLHLDSYEMGWSLFMVKIGFISNI